MTDTTPEEPTRKVFIVGDDAIMKHTIQKAMTQPEPMTVEEHVEKLLDELEAFGHYDPESSQYPFDICYRHIKNILQAERERIEQWLDRQIQDNRSSIGNMSAISSARRSGQVQAYETVKQAIQGDKP